MKMRLLSLAIIGFSGHAVAGNTIELNYTLNSGLAQAKGTCTADKITEAIDKEGFNYDIAGLFCPDPPKQLKSDNVVGLVSVGKLSISGWSQSFEVLARTQAIAKNADGNKISYEFELRLDTPTAIPVPPLTPVPATPVPATPVLNDCKDDQASSSAAVCAAKNIKIIDRYNGGTTYLPGCAENPSLSIPFCQFMGKMGNTTYAIRFKFSEIKGDAKDKVISIQSVARDFYVDAQYRQFDMAISERPGDFIGAKVACSKKGLDDGYDLNIYGKQVKSVGDELMLGENECPLTPDKDYFVNVKASSAECIAADSSVPFNGCRTYIAARVPLSN